MYNKRIIFLYKINIDYLVQDVIIIISTHTTPTQSTLTISIDFTLFHKSVIMVVTN